MKLRYLIFPLIFVGLVSSLYSTDVKFGGELRLRPEYRGNPDFNKDTHESNSFVGSRLRITGSGQAAEDVNVKVTFQDTRNWGEEAGASNGLTDTGEAVDIHEGYVEFAHFLHSAFNLRAGRQELLFGDQRLVGNLGWSNQARAFDAFKVSFADDLLSLDLFTAKRKENNGTTASNPGTDRDLSGVYSAWKKLIPQSVVDVYFFSDREGDTASVAKSKNIYTLGSRLSGKVSRFDYTFEMPFQFGDNGTVVGVSSDNVKVSAYALAAKAGYTFLGDRQIRLGAEYDFASGDNNSSDKKSKTFNNLYPTNHSYYGLMDNQGWRNMKALNFSLSAKPTTLTFVSASFWDFHLADKKDGWYNAAGSAAGSLRSASSINTNSHVGSEVDLLARFNQSEMILWEVGYGHFFAGQFIKDRVQNEADSDWAYLMSSVKF